MIYRTKTARRIPQPFFRSQGNETELTRTYTTQPGNLGSIPAPPWPWIAGAAAAIVLLWWLTRPNKAQRRRRALSAAKKKYSTQVARIRRRYA